MHHVDSTPQLTQRIVNGLSLACTVELEVDHDVVGIVGRSEDPVAAHTRTLAADWIAVEDLLPRVEVGYWCSIRSMCISVPLLSDVLVAGEEWHKVKPRAPTKAIHRAAQRLAFSETHIYDPVWLGS
jgi:hypothetical protein